MILPDVFSDVTPHEIPVNDETTITLGLRLVPGQLWDDITRHYARLSQALTPDPGEEDRESFRKTRDKFDDEFIVARLTAGIEWIEATGHMRTLFAPPVDKLTGGDPDDWPDLDDGRTAIAAAEQLWGTWPKDPRVNAIRAVVAHNESAPKAGTTRKPNDGTETPDTDEPPE